MKYLPFVFTLLVILEVEGQRSQLINVEVGKQIGISGEAGTPRDLANLAYFPGFNLSPHANELDAFLRSEYLPLLDIEMAAKQDLMEQRDFQEFKSPYFKDKNSGQDASGQHRSNALTGAYSWADGYVPWTYKTPLMDGYDDFPRIREFFPETELFITAELGFSYIIDSDPSISPVLIIEYRKAESGAHKKLYYTTFVEIPPDRRDAVLKAPTDANITMEELKKTLRPLFDEMLEGIEKEKHKIRKFLESH